jgi:hypothetical protein
MDLSFQANHPWALLPRKIKVDLRAKQQEVEMFQENFHWVRMGRSSELCYPWRLGEEMGWVVDSPVDICMDAIHDVEVNCLEAEVANVANMAHATEFHWAASKTTKEQQYALFTRNAGWIRLFEYRTPRGFRSMFLPIGQGAVEWHLGFDAIIPAKHFLLVMPYRHYPNLEVVTGVLDSKSSERFDDKAGFSIGVRPLGPVKLTRGQPIARLVLLPAFSVLGGAPAPSAPESAPTSGNPSSGNPS